MDEEKPKEEAKPVEDIAEGDKPESTDKVERAEQAVKRMEDGEKRIDEKIKKLQDLEADRLLGSTAGGRVEAEPAKEQTAAEYADEVMLGKIKAQ